MLLRGTASCKTEMKKPNLGAFVMVFAVASGTAMASDHFVKRSTTVSKYLFPLAVLGRGPVPSIDTGLKRERILFCCIGARCFCGWAVF